MHTTALQNAQHSWQTGGPDTQMLFIHYLFRSKELNRESLEVPVDEDVKFLRVSIELPHSFKNAARVLLWRRELF